MPIARLHFFALAGDWAFVLNWLEKKHPVRYTSMNHKHLSQPPAYERWQDIPRLGIAAGEQTLLSDSYLITHRETRMELMPRQQFDGRRRFDVHQLPNPDSVRLFAAGRWKNMIISGLIDTMSNGSVAQSLMRGFQAPMKKAFTRADLYWVGPEALRCWESGQRLADAEQSPPEYDLRRVN